MSPVIDVKFVLEELRAIQTYIEERKVFLEKNFTADGTGSRDAKEGDFDGLPWHETRTGNGEIVFKTDVPDWVRRYPDIDGKEGAHVSGRVYKLFESGVLWRK